MQPLEFCLDRILEELKKSWDNPDRPKLCATDLLKEFGIPQDRHELFRSLINKMIDDGYVDFIDKVEDRKSASLITYEERTMLTAVGYYFIASKNGYKAKEKQAKAKDKLATDLNDSNLKTGKWTRKNILVTGSIAVITLMFVIGNWYINYKKYHQESYKLKTVSLQDLKQQQDSEKLFQELGQIRQYLKDTANVKVKIEK